MAADAACIRDDKEGKTRHHIFDWDPRTAKDRLCVRANARGRLFQDILTRACNPARWRLRIGRRLDPIHAQAHAVVATPGAARPRTV